MSRGQPLAGLRLHRLVHLRQAFGAHLGRPPRRQRVLDRVEHVQPGAERLRHPLANSTERSNASSGPAVQQDLSHPAFRSSSPPELGFVCKPVTSRPAPPPEFPQPCMMARMPKLTVEGFGTVDVEDGKRLVLAIEQDAEVDILHACGGNARCTTCRVEFIEGEPTADDGGRAAGAGGPRRHRRPALVPDPLRSRHDRPRDQPARRQRPCRIPAGHAARRRSRRRRSGSLQHGFRLDRDQRQTGSARSAPGSSGSGTR